MYIHIYIYVHVLYIYIHTHPLRCLTILLNASRVRSTEVTSTIGLAIYNSLKAAKYLVMAADARRSHAQQNNGCSIAEQK